MIDTIGSELCIASPHMLKIIFQVDWLEIHWNSNHILNQLHTYCILYHRRVTLKSIVRFIFYLYIPRWISLLFFFRLLFSTMFRSFRSFFSRFHRTIQFTVVSLYIFFLLTFESEKYFRLLTLNEKWWKNKNNNQSKRFSFSCSTDLALQLSNRFLFLDL